MTPTRSGQAATRARSAPARVATDTLPIARVAVDVPLAHLDRPFDYLVAESDAEAAQPGVRVRVRFAGRRVNGFVLERCEKSDHDGKLAMIDKVISSERVLTPEVAGLCRAVADRYAGTLADVLRLAVPPRRAKVETEPGASSDAGRGSAVISEQAESTGWRHYPAGDAFLAAVRGGSAVRAVWQALPGEDWPARLADAAAAAVSAGRGALLVAPDARDVARIDAALTERLPPGTHVALTADLGPTERYRRFVAVLRGRARVVVGTRAAAFAPVHGLGLVAVFDDGDDLLAEPHAPYPHARDVLMLRSIRQQAALLVGGVARTAEGQLMVRSGWARSITADRATVRTHMPRIEAAADERAPWADSSTAHTRLGPAAFHAARAALGDGAPVLVQVPRGGYLPGLACDACRRLARCRRCGGPLALRRGSGTPSCRWCGVAAPRWACPACASTRLRATVTGQARTADEFGRAFPGVRVRTSSGAGVLDTVPREPAIVVATPGAEPVADGGYGAALLLDGHLLLGRADLRASEETLRRWMAAATLVRPAADGGRVVVGAEAAIATVQALIRWDPAGAAAAELDARSELGFPPAATMASVEGSEQTVGDAVAALDAPSSTEELGPVPIAPRRRSSSRDEQPGRKGTENASLVADNAPMVRTLLRVPAAERGELARSLQVLAAARSARKDSTPLRIEMDPVELG